MKSIRVAVLYGGVSSEREVALRSGATVIDALKEADFSVTAFDPKTELPEFIAAAAAGKFDIVVPVLHGAFGEDGTVQGLLDLLHVPYLFSNCRTSAICMDKEVTKLIAEKAGVPVLPQIILTKNAPISLKQGTTALKLPVVVKPVAAGSSVGVTIVKKNSELKKAIAEALRHSERVLIEPYIVGREITVNMWRFKNKTEVLALTEIIAQKDTFYSYDAKYAPGGSRHVCPAQLPARTAATLRRHAIAAFEALGCRDIARPDFMLDAKTGDMYFLEMNTIPGMTTTSLIPEAIRAAGKTLSGVLKQLINERLTRKK